MAFVKVDQMRSELLLSIKVHIILSLLPYSCCCMPCLTPLQLPRRLPAFVLYQSTRSTSRSAHNLTALHRISPIVHIVLRSRGTFCYALRCTTLCTNHLRARPRRVRAVSASRCMLGFANVLCQMPYRCVASPASTPRHT